MNLLYEAAVEIQTFLRSQRWKFCIIGGLAVLRWGQPRATRDVDISLLTGLGSEENIVDGILARFPGRIREARQFALDNRILLARASNGTALDIALAAFPFEEAVIDRSSDFEIAAGVVLRTASAEDLIVLKSFAGRDRDWSDVEGIVLRQGGQLAWSDIGQQQELLREMKPDEDFVGRLAELRRRLGATRKPKKN